jgi:hypothetical protein
MGMVGVYDGYAMGWEARQVVNHGQHTVEASQLAYACVCYM